MSFAYNTPIQFVPGIGWRTANVMHTLGIHTVGQLNKIPENILIELFGPSIRSILHMVGFTVRPVQQHTDAVTVSTRTQTEKPTWRKRLQIATRVMSLL